MTKHAFHFRLGRTKDGRVSTVAEAYAAYGRESNPIFSRVGGRIIWRGKFELTLTGPHAEAWDECFIAEYPSVAAFVEMIRDPLYREAVKHRQAAVEDSVGSFIDEEDVQPHGSRNDRKTEIRRSSWGVGRRHGKQADPPLGEP